MRYPTPPHLILAAFCFSQARASSAYRASVLLCLRGVRFGLREISKADLKGLHDIDYFFTIHHLPLRDGRGGLLSRLE